MYRRRSKMFGRIIPFVFVTLSLLLTDIYGLRPKDDIRKCPKGTPVSRDCNPRMFPSTCPSGSYCYSPTDGSGLCCRDSAKVTCSNLATPAGPCTSGDQCPIGHYCETTLVGGPGTCCSIDIHPLLPSCRNGGIPNGRCLPSISNQCTEGFFCQDSPGDTMGFCCPTRIVQPPLGSCPVSMFGPCVFRPDVIMCQSDNDCRQGQRCCPDGCGKVCKYVGGGSYVP